MIPTRQKEKLPSGFSYAVGAEQISAALVDLPVVELTFWWRDTFWSSTYKGKVKAKGELELMICERHSGAEEYFVRINALLSADRQVVQKELLQVGLPRLREELLRRHPKNGQIKLHKFVACFAIDTQTMRYDIY